MYEELIAFLLGKKSELSEEDLREFMDLLCNALEVSEECKTLEKHSIIENMVDSANIKNRTERAVVSGAIEKILQFHSESEEETSEDILEDRSDETPLRNRKVRRGNFSRAPVGGASTGGMDGSNCREQSIIATSTHSGQNVAPPSQIFIEPEGRSGFTALDTEDGTKKFEFVIGDLEENHCEGPSFAFNLDE